MDIKKTITDAVEKITKDEATQAEFKKDPIKTVEKVAGVDLPDGTVEKIVEAVKGKLSLDAIGGKFDGLKKLF